MRRRVLVTRAAEQSARICALLSEAGFDPVVHPAIRFEKGTLTPVLEALSTADWLLFTSANGVRFFFDDPDVRPLTALPARIGAVGSATREEVEARGHRVDFIPEVFQAEELASSLPNVAGLNIIIPQAEGARPVLAEILLSRGASVVTAPAYRTVTAPGGRPPSNVDAVTFTSPSTVTGYLEQGGSVGDAVVACIGPITASAAEQAGLWPDIIAKPQTTEGLVSGLLHHFRIDA